MNFVNRTVAKAYFHYTAYKVRYVLEGSLSRGSSALALWDEASRASSGLWDGMVQQNNTTAVLPQECFNSFHIMT